MAGGARPAPHPNFLPASGKKGIPWRRAPPTGYFFTSGQAEAASFPKASSPLIVLMSL